MSIDREGQKFADIPIRIRPKKMPSVMELSVALSCGRRPEIPKPIVVGHERVQLRWMEPDGKGGLREKK